jgi:hypothetical protein
MWATKFHTHTKTTGKIIVLCILIFTFSDSKLEDKRFFTEYQQAFPDFNLLLISSWTEFCFVRAIFKYLMGLGLLAPRPINFSTMWRLVVCIALR